MGQNLHHTLIALNPFQSADFDRLIQWVHSEEEMVQWSGPLFSFPITHNQLENYMRADNRLIYTVKDLNSSEIIGHAELNAIDTVQKSARICRVLIGDKHNRNKGYGTLIIQELIRIGFKELQLHSLDLRVFDFNKQAITCYSNCGFQIQELSKENYTFGDTCWSMYTMSIYNTDF